MRYPIYDAGQYPSPDVSLVDAYMTLIGRDERDNQAEIDKLPRGDSRRASFQIGRACLLGKRNSSESQRLVRSAHRELDPKHPDAYVRRIHTLRTVARMIELKDDDTSVLNLRRNLHRQAVESAINVSRQLKSYIGTAAPEVKEWVGECRGRQTEDHINALLNRPLHPWFMGVSALEHHDRRLRSSRRDSICATAAGNFDLAFVESFPAGMQPDQSDETFLLNKLQIKRNCFGQCRRGSHLADYYQDVFEAEVRPQYTSDITLLSGCCDIELANTDSLNPVDMMLREEFRNNITSESVLALDDLTDHLLFVIRNSEELGRRGTFDVEPVASLAQ